GRAGGGDVRGVLRLLLPEDVRMALRHLAGDAAGDVVDLEPASLGGERRKEEDLEEQVAELVGQRFRVHRVEGLERLVALLEQVGLDRLGRLLAVPRAFPAQPGDESAEIRQPFAHAGNHRRRLRKGKNQKLREAQDDGDRRRETEPDRGWQDVHGERGHASRLRAGGGARAGEAAAAPAAGVPPEDRAPPGPSADGRRRGRSRRASRAGRPRARRAENRFRLAHPVARHAGLLLARATAGPLRRPAPRSRRRPADDRVARGPRAEDPGQHLLRGVGLPLEDPLRASPRLCRDDSAGGRAARPVIGKRKSETGRGFMPFRFPIGDSRFPVLLFLLVHPFVAAAVLAQEPVSQLPPPLPPPVTRGLYRSRWFEFLNAHLEDDARGAAAALRELKKAAQAVGVHRLSDFSRTATFEGRLAETRGRFDRAARAYDAALELDDVNSDAHFSRLAFLLRQKAFGKAA